MNAGVLLTIGLALGVAAPLAAQRPGMRPRPMAPAAGQRPLAPEIALRLRDSLQLTQDQLRQLRSLREETIKAREADRAAVADLRSRLMAGEITRQEFRTRMTERVNALETRREQRGDPARALLSDTQRERLKAFQQQTRQERAARGGAGLGPRNGMGMRHPGGMGMRRPGMPSPQRGLRGRVARPVPPPGPPGEI